MTEQPLAAMGDGDGLQLLSEVHIYEYYDGPLSGVARTCVGHLPYVWFTAIAVRLWPFLRIYSLAAIDEASYSRLAGSLTSDENVSQSEIEAIVRKFAVPTWYCLSLDYLRTVSVLRKLPGEYAAEINQFNEDMPFDSPTYQKWLQRILDFGKNER